MARFGHGPRSKTRHKLQKDKRKNTGITKYLRKFEPGDMVAIVIDPSSHNFPHPRYHGRVCKVVGKRGRAYILEMKDGNKIKTFFVTPEHLVKLNYEGNK